MEKHLSSDREWLDLVYDKYDLLIKFKEACENHWRYYGYEKQSYLVNHYKEIFGVTPKLMYDDEKDYQYSNLTELGHDEMNEAIDEGLHNIYKKTLRDRSNAD